MNPVVNYQVDGDVAVIVMDRPPLNTLGHVLRAGVLEALAQANANPAVRVVVLTGTARAFSAGADIREFGTPAAAQEPALGALIRALEDSAKPVVAAIAGVCLGGGFELALGAHFRVALEDAQVGLPEVRLGLLPGAGGTQRLPRLIGVERALKLILDGGSVAAGDLAATPLFDRVDKGDLTAAAVAFARHTVAAGLPALRTRERTVPEPGAQAALEVARGQVDNDKDLSLRPARRNCIEAVAASLRQPFDEALRAERELFLAAMRTPESRARRHIFQAERAATKIKDVPEDAVSRPIRKVGVVGAGTMGGGIAMSFLNAGIPVVLVETRQEALERGLATIRRNYDTSAKKGKLSQQQVEERIALLTPTLASTELAEVDLVIEAVFEDLGVKEQVFNRLDAVCKPGTILASNTSYLDIDRIASFTRRPEDVLGLHFFSPANVMRLLEVVRGAKTAPQVLATCLQLGRRIGKIAVVAGVCDGFIGNRMLARYIAAAIGAVEAGASPAQVDGALQRFGMAMGPLRMGDLAGLDIGWAMRKRRAAEAGIPFVPGIPDKLCEAGRHGQKTGAGWYRYEAGQRTPIPDPATEDIIAAYRCAQGIQPRVVSDEEIVERCIFALVNEGARILAEGIAARASDIDLVYLNGYGFPTLRGGPMFHAGVVGLAHVVERLRRFAAEPGAQPWWQPAPLLCELAAAGRAFG